MLSEKSFLSELRLHCFFCLRSLESSYFFRCKVCENNFSCQSCFARTARGNRHDPLHEFSVVPPMLNRTKTKVLLRLFKEDTHVKKARMDIHEPLSDADDGITEGAEDPEAGQHGLDIMCHDSKHDTLLQVEQEKLDEDGIFEKDYNPFLSILGQKTEPPRPCFEGSDTELNDLIELFSIVKGVESYGTDNWDAVSATVGRSPGDCKRLFYHHVLNIDLDALEREEMAELVNPNNQPHHQRQATSAEDSLRELAKISSDASMKTAQPFSPFPQHPQKQLQDQDAAALVTVGTATGPPSGKTISSDGIVGQPIIRTQETRAAHVLSYSSFSPIRDEFETQYDNEYEHVLKNLCLSEAEETVLPLASILFPEKVQLRFVKDLISETEYNHLTSLMFKLLNLSVFSRLLERRGRYLQIIKEYSLWNIKSYDLKARRHIREEKDIFMTYQHLIKYLGQLEFSQLVTGLHEYPKLYNFLQDAYKKKSQLGLAKGMSPPLSIRDHLNELKRHEENAEPYYIYVLPAKSGQSNNGRGIKGDSNHVNGGMHPYAGISSASFMANQDPLSGAYNHGENAEHTSTRPRFLVTPDMDGYDELAKHDIALCIDCRIPPRRFLDVRAEMLLLAAERDNTLKLSIARKGIKLDVNKTKKIFSHLIQHGHFALGT